MPLEPTRNRSVRRCRHDEGKGSLFGVPKRGVYSKRGRVGAFMTAKETVRALLDRLPDDCSLEDVQYHLYVVQAVESGVADSEAGRTISQEEVVADLRRKWQLGPVQ